MMEKEIPLKNICIVGVCYTSLTSWGAEALYLKISFLSVGLTRQAPSMLVYLCVFNGFSQVGSVQDFGSLLSKSGFIKPLAGTLLLSLASMETNLWSLNKPEELVWDSGDSRLVRCFATDFLSDLEQVTYHPVPESHCRTSLVKFVRHMGTTVL